MMGKVELIVIELSGIESRYSNQFKMFIIYKKKVKAMSPYSGNIKSIDKKKIPIYLFNRCFSMVKDL